MAAGVADEEHAVDDRLAQGVGDDAAVPVARGAHGVALAQPAMPGASGVRSYEATPARAWSREGKFQA